MGAKKSTWVFGTGFLGLVILLAGWFLAIAPTLTAAAETRAEAASVEDHNDLLRLQLSTLKKQYENLDEYKAELAELKVQIPSTAELADYLREISTLAEASGATIIDLAPGTPLDVVPLVAEVAPVAPSEATDGSAAQEPETEEPVETVPSVPVGPTSIPGYVAVPISFTALGNVPSIVTFLDSLQTGSQRLFLVTGLDGKGQDETEAAGGRPATELGDLELKISGYIYVLEDVSVQAAPDAIDPEPLPVPTDGKTPFSAT